jgi:hypothetical protein
VTAVPRFKGPTAQFKMAQKPEVPSESSAICPVRMSSGLLLVPDLRNSSKISRRFPVSHQSNCKTASEI